MKMNSQSISLVFMLLIAIMSVSCSKDRDNGQQDLTMGPVTGSVRLYDKFRNDNLNYSDVKVELIVNKKSISTKTPNSNGSFTFDRVSFGPIFMKIMKPGYGIIDTLRFNHTKSTDTLSEIVLLEEYPFSFNQYQVSYLNNRISYFRSTVYNTTDTYLVTDLMCFSKDPSVSLNHSKYAVSTSSFTSVAFINSVQNSSFTCSIDNFTRNGFQAGDKVYSVCYPIDAKFFNIYLNRSPNQNFEIISFKAGNPSQVSSFTLN